ncbi:MAG: peptidase U32 family protein, partial [Christensenellales bacterium]
MEKIELLSPAGDMEKLKTAFYFGADACYFAGKKFGLRAFSSNFDDEQLKESIEYAHKLGKKCYITLNILAHNADFDGMAEYIKYLDEIHADAVIVSDIGIMSLVKTVAPNLEIHVSTQANITNKYSAMEFVKFGAKRLILARELSIEEIKEIRDYIPKDIVLETFVHGAMCISYSGRCLLSNYLTGRDSNRGACVQACRWEYCIREKNRDDYMEVQEDNRGTYILNSKDLCMIEHIKDLYDAGVRSFKIEGRMKSPYYVATTTNAYRRAVDEFYESKQLDKTLVDE